MEAFLDRFVGAEMPTREIPMTWTIRHPRRAPEHQYLSTVSDYTMNPNPELRLSHLPLREKD